MVEVALELLIRKVDAELLEAIPLEVLKAKDVQDADVEVVLGRVGLQVTVEPGHDPAEQSRVQGLGQRVPDIGCLGALVALVKRLTCKMEVRVCEELPSGCSLLVRIQK